MKEFLPNGWPKHPDYLRVHNGWLGVSTQQPSEGTTQPPKETIKEVLKAEKTQSPDYVGGSK